VEAAAAQCEAYAAESDGATAVLLRAAAEADLLELAETEALVTGARVALESVVTAEDPASVAAEVARGPHTGHLRAVLAELSDPDDDERTRPSIVSPTAPGDPATHLLRAVWHNGTSEIIPCRDGDNIVIGPEGALPQTMVPRTCYGGDAGVDVIVRGAEVPLVDLQRLEDAAEAVTIVTPDVPIDLESVRKVCLSLLDQALEAVRAWPDPGAKTRLARILPVLEDGLRRLAA
jgi:hypothetical protein